MSNVHKMKQHVTICLVWMLTLSAFSQNQVMKQADSLFQSKNWLEASRAYEMITKENPNQKTGLSYYRLATSYYFLGRLIEAAPLFRRAIEISQNPNVMYSLACVLNRLEEKDSCYAWLDRAVAKGFNQYQQLLDDDDLKNLREETRFNEIVKTMKVKALPCLRDPQYRQFDFWIGSWTVYDTKTHRLAGKSEIKLLLGDCVLMENWEPTSGYAGKSFNVYNEVEKKWRQTYVDASGKYAEYYDGELSDRSLQFKLKMPTGSSARNRMTFILIGKDEVKQIGETSPDMGATWVVEFDLTYKRNYPFN